MKLEQSQDLSMTAKLVFRNYAPLFYYFCKANPERKAGSQNWAPTSADFYPEGTH